MSDYKNNLDRYRHYCDTLESPDVYIEYSFYSLISACLQRRLWLGDKDREIYPNLYIIFVGPPGTGKTVAAKANAKILQQFKRLKKNKVDEYEDVIHVAPDATNMEALVYKLAQISDAFIPEDGVVRGHASLTFISEELGNLFRKNHDDLIAFLCQGFDGDDYKKETRHSGCDYIKKMCLNLLGSTTPAWLRDSIASTAIDQGLTARMIFINGGRPTKVNLIHTLSSSQIACLEYIREYCRTLTLINGRCSFTPEAYDYFNNWYVDFRSKLDKGIVLNPDKRLENYYSRKRIHAMKLSMVIHFSDNHNLLIGKQSIEKSLNTLDRIEMNMHEAFASSSRNPVHTLSVNILKLLKAKDKPYKLTQLYMHFHDEGGMEQIEMALKFLLQTEQIKCYQDSNSGKVVYEISENVNI